MPVLDSFLILHVDPADQDTLVSALTAHGINVEASTKKSFDGHAEIAIIVATLALGREVIRALRDVLLEHLRGKNLRYVKLPDGSEIRDPDVDSLTALLSQLQSRVANRPAGRDEEK